MMFIWQNVSTTLDQLQKIPTSLFEGLGETKPASGGNKKGGNGENGENGQMSNAA